MFRIFFFCFFLVHLSAFAQDSLKIVTRNTKAPIEVNGALIRQDKRNIGFVRFLEPYNSGEPTRVCQIFIPNGTQVATAFAYGKASHEWVIMMLKNPDITFEVTSKEGSDAKDIATVLIKNGYL